MTESFANWMQSVQNTIEKTLDELLPSEELIPVKLHQAMRYAVLDGGKRIRPLLVFATGTLFGAQPDIMARVASAVEMIHAYSLIHDDLPCMDDSDYRRGKLSNHKVFGETTAVLAGDALLNRAFEVMSEPDQKIAPQDLLRAPV